MKIRLFYHSLLSDWNHDNAHFLRGIVSELKARGHDVAVFEPRNSWSLQNVTSDYGEGPPLRWQLAGRGLARIHSRHTCAHRVDELATIYDDLRRGFPADIALELGAAAVPEVIGKHTSLN